MVCNPSLVEIERLQSSLKIETSALMDAAPSKT